MSLPKESLICIDNQVVVNVHKLQLYLVNVLIQHLVLDFDAGIIIYISAISILLSDVVSFSPALNNGFQAA